MRWWLAVVAALTSIGPAHADWFEATGTHVRVIAEGNADQAQALADKLERFDAALRHLRNVEPGDAGPAGRLTVYVVPSADMMTRISNRRMIAGFYVPRAGGSVAFVPRRNSAGGALALKAESVLLHEYTHHFVARHFAFPYPQWLNEGFAEFHGTAQFDRDGSVTIGHAPQYRAYGLLSGTQLSIERLLDPGERRMGPQEFDNFYGRGWLLLHYLTFAEDRAGQLSSYLGQLAKGDDGLEAGRAAFGDLRTLDRELDRYTTRRLTALRIPADKLDVAPIVVRRMGDAEGAVMEAHIESRAGVTAEEAAKLLPKVQRIAARYPDDAFVAGVLAEAEYDAGRYAAARDAALRAIAIDPSSRQGHIYHGMALSALALEAGDRSPATYKAVLAPWIRANRLDPDDPKPMMLIYLLAHQFGQRDPSIAKGVKYAQLLAPEDRTLRLMAAAEYLRDGKADDARLLVTSLAYDPHAGSRERLLPVIEAIDANDAPRALALIESPGQAAAIDAAP